MAGDSSLFCPVWATWQVTVLFILSGLGTMAGDSSFILCPDWIRAAFILSSLGTMAGDSSFILSGLGTMAGDSSFFLVRSGHHGG